MLVPSCLIGNQKQAKRQLQVLVREVLKTGEWPSALASATWLDTLTTPLVIETERPIYNGPNSCRLDMVPLVIMEATKEGLDVCNPEDRILWFKRRRDLILSGCEYPWFSLVLAGGHPPLFPTTPLTPVEEPSIIYRIVTKNLEHWEQYTSLEFAIGWDFWATGVKVNLRELGAGRDVLDKDLCRTPQTFKPVLEKWLEICRHKEEFTRPLDMWDWLPR